MKKILILLWIATALVSARAELIVFDFASPSGGNQTGIDLDGLESGTASVDGSLFTVTLEATAGLNASGDLLNYVTSPNFGINASGSGDLTDAFDDGAGNSEFMNFLFTASLPAIYTFVSIDFDRITGSGALGEDSGSLSFAEGSTFSFDGSNVDGSGLFTVGESITAGQVVTLSHVAGNGFGLEQVTLEVIPIPEPKTTALILGLGLGALGLACRRRSTR